LTLRLTMILLTCVVLGSHDSMAAAEDTLWRVVSQRIILSDAAQTLQRKLQAMGLQPQLFVRREAVKLHVFDDPAIYHSHTAVEAARAQWQQLGIDADIYPLPGHRFRIGLGRYYLDEYALARQQQLSAVGHAFTYRRMQKTIPVYRLTFPPGQRNEAKKLWQSLHRTGMGNAVLMPETAFDKLYPRLRAEQSDAYASANNSAKRSNR